jgi:hypothetical protein
VSSRASRIFPVTDFVLQHPRRAVVETSAKRIGGG